MARAGYVYILSNKKHGTLYIGVTSDLIKRIWQHRNNEVEGFSKRYNLHSLVYYEQFDDIREAIEREKQLKRWHRKWKLNLISHKNPDWIDLYKTL